ncbi:unnamed protein product [Meloidogyne enterolobii]|uniref:Uncharacterized protein n=1 Tax=Meloidogyne enterolobii TaxID=390850 RepID=A0ACB0XMR8_MELEN
MSLGTESSKLWKTAGIINFPFLFPSFFSFFRLLPLLFSGLSISFIHASFSFFRWYSSFIRLPLLLHFPLLFFFFLFSFIRPFFFFHYFSFSFIRASSFLVFIRSSFLLLFTFFSPIFFISGHSIPPRTNPLPVVCFRQF